MNLARRESLSFRDRRLFDAVFRTMERGFANRRFVPLSERAEVSYMILHAVSRELPNPTRHRAGLPLFGGRLTLRLTARSLAFGLVADDDAEGVTLLLPMIVVRWYR